MRKCLIISGGEKSSLPSGTNDYYVIACDKGYKYAKEDGIRVDLLVGDFDSYNEKLPETIEIEKLPCEKDDTDTMHAIRSALQRGYKDITICCCFGGRLDHLVSNIQTGAYAKEMGANICLADNNNEVFYIKNETCILEKRKDSFLSLLSYTDKCTGVSISGAKYEVSNVTLTNHYPLGQSNEWKDEKITVTCENGLLLAIVSKK